MNTLTGKWALVTGASRGIGRQIAFGLAAEGASLVLHSRSLEHTADMAKELAAKGTTVHQLACDLGDHAAVHDMATKVLSLTRGLDVLYNNAAVMTAYHEKYLEVVPSEFELSFRVNVITPILLCNFFLPEMLRRKWGRIVNMTSGIAEQPELTAYSISKAALDKYVYDIAPKLKGTGVTMNLMDPGWLRTDLGGPNAPGAVESVLPGALVPILADDAVSGKFFRAQDYHKG